MHALRSRRFSLLAVVGLLALLAGVWGCSDDVLSPADQSTDLSPEAIAKSAANPDVRAVMAIQERYTPALMADPEVIGTATTIGDDGQPIVLLFVTSDRAQRGAPTVLDGVAVKVHLTDRFVAMRGRPSATPPHTALQAPPIQMGTTGGWKFDLANGYCCGGTLGSLIQVGSQKRILSNYHVFEADIVAGGNNIVATTGDPIIHPALIDIGCNAGSALEVATLVVTSSIPGANVDCSSANIISGMVDESGAILEIGTLSSQTVAAYVGQPVKKSGRTTGLTRSTVSALNATVSISYEDECAGDPAFTKTYTGQIMILNSRSAFLAGGDSGSLMVEDVLTNPRAVGLLYAGSNTSAIANPIDEVLGFFGATMVGN